MCYRSPSHEVLLFRGSLTPTPGGTFGTNDLACASFVGKKNAQRSGRTAFTDKFWDLFSASAGTIGPVSETSEASSVRRRSTPSGPLDSSAPSARQTIPQKASAHFVIPPEPPSKDQWVPDYEAEICMVCHITRFSMVNLFLLSCTMNPFC